MLKFTNEFKIILPKKDNEGIALDHEKQVINLCKVFGGATVTENNGFWFDEGKLYKDENIQVACFYSELDNTMKEAIKEVVSYGFNDCKQLAITVTINGVNVILEEAEEVNELL